jgi:23S rRNA (adenine1618-N6)-methyltransferase
MLGKKTRRDFNHKINKKSIYFNNPPNFVKLAEEFPDFRKYLKKLDNGEFSLDWKNDNAMRELCKVLLEKDFGIKFWEIPQGYLIPTITSRCNYINWIHDILEQNGILNRTENIRGLDIGTGANCIYPLLGYSLYKWEFKASDINPISIDNAQNILDNNNFGDKITLKLQKDEFCIFYNVLELGEKFDFSMSNPPYFSEDEVKHDNPNTVCVYDDREVYCKGGEKEFIERMINESYYFRYDVEWFTTLVGKKINLSLFESILNSDINIEKVLSTTFYQGKMLRWGLAWKYKREHIRRDRVIVNSIDY